MKYKKYLVKISQPIKSFNHTINVDSDKSISIRSAGGSISHDISKISNALNSEDVQSTIICLKSLGVKIKKLANKIMMFTEKDWVPLWQQKKLV